MFLFPGFRTKYEECLGVVYSLLQWSRANTVSMVTHHLFVTDHACLVAQPYSLSVRFENEIWLSFESICYSKLSFNQAL
jgi:hypothetical protein